MKLIFALLALLPMAAHAGYCQTTTDKGQPAYLNQPDSKGKINPLKYLSGVIAKLPICKVDAIIVQRVTYEDYVAPDPVNDCEKQAVLACDTSFKGLPIGNVGNMKGYCGFAFVTTKVNAEDTTIRYVNGAVYDGHTFNGYDKDNTCRSPLDINNVKVE